MHLKLCILIKNILIYSTLNLITKFILLYLAIEVKSNDDFKTGWSSDRNFARKQRDPWKTNWTSVVRQNT